MKLNIGEELKAEGVESSQKKSPTYLATRFVWFLRN